MSYKVGNRMQQTLLPASIDDYVSEADPVRVYDAFVDALNFEHLGIPITPFQSGAESYYPKHMVKLFIYGYSYGIRSSRKLERACRHNLSFIWLMGGLTPDYRTIARFRDTYKDAIKNILKQSVHMCIKLDLIEGNTLFVDGSVFKANASLANTWDKKRCEKSMVKVNEHIDELIDKIQRTDRYEDNQESLVEVKEQLRSSEQRKKEIESIVRELDQRQESCSKEQKAFYNTTDPESIKIHKSYKTAVGYNVQLAVDAKHGLIVHSESTDIPNDAQQLSQQVQQAQETLQQKPQTVCSDTGYYSTKDFGKIAKDIRLVVPNQKQVLKERHAQQPNPFDKEHFRYDTEHDCYTCPAGKQLNPAGIDKQKQTRVYRARAADCQTCAYFSQCTSSKRARTIKRLIQETLKEQMEKIYDSPEGQDIYVLRKQKVELPFGHFKRNLCAERFLLRGKAGSNAEISLLSTCFNIARMITLIGIPILIRNMQAL